MLRAAELFLSALLICALVASGSLIVWLAEPCTEKISAPSVKTPWVFGGQGFKFLGLSEGNVRKKAHFTFAGSRALASKAGIEKQELAFVRGYIQTRLNNDSQELYYFSAPTGTYTPAASSLEMDESHFTLCEMPGREPRERLYLSEPALEGSAKKAVISLNQGAVLEAMRIKAIIYDTKRLEPKHRHE